MQNNKLGKKELITFNKFFRVLEEVKKQNEKINIENIKTFYVYDQYNGELINNIPPNTETLIIDYYYVERHGKILNLPITIKTIIINALLLDYCEVAANEEEIKKNIKIPFGAEVHIFDDEKHFPDYHTSTAFIKFLTETHNIKLNETYTNIIYKNDILFSKMSQKNYNNSIQLFKEYPTGYKLAISKKHEYIFHHKSYIEKLLQKLN